MNKNCNNKPKILLNALKVWPFNYVFIGNLIEHFK